MAYLYLASEKAKLFSLVKTRLQLNTKIGINHHPQASLIFQVYRLNLPFFKIVNFEERELLYNSWGWKKAPKSLQMVITCSIRLHLLIVFHCYCKGVLKINPECSKGVSSCFKGVLGYFKSVSRVFLGWINGVSRGFKGITRLFWQCFRYISKVFHCVSRVFFGCITRVLHFCFKGDSRVFQLYFEDVSRIL